ncbi:CUB domain-containing protein 1a isoform X2 [Parambassis ranga]|uniref:CUB domain-containing protein 1a isoform X2 n=1 Tax=Parambassis ranga TaxID=210632 RepID=A0A6P7K0G2_9TELE|nr:CUB domain-containing protein 1 isoform X2 [Parambassis ranga]
MKRALISGDFSRDYTSTPGTSMSLASIQVLLLTSIVSSVSGLTITPERGTTLRITSPQVYGCKVCTESGRSQQCTSSLLLQDSTAVSVKFTCTAPENEFTVEVVQNIKCTTSCSGNILQADFGSLPLQGFKRRFTWNISALAPKAFKIDFTRIGLRQINPSERCPDRHTYNLQAVQTTGKVAVGTYCRSGPISSAQILKQGSFSLDVSAGSQLQSGQFEVSVGEEIKSLAKISVTLPKENPTSDLLSPNYPDSFPDDDSMEWYFDVPDKHKTTVQLLNLVQPSCLKKQAAVEYYRTGRSALVLRLTDTQPDQTQGDFSLMLRNCEMDRRRSGSPGLSVNIRVSASSTASLVSCQVDLGKEGVSLHINKLRPASDCKMKMDSVMKETITVTSSSDLSFQDCLPEDIQVTATRVIECSRLCPTIPIPLLVPLVPSCLPAPLNSMTWTLRPAEHGTVLLTAPTGPLKQSLPGQICNDSISIEVAEEDGNTVGVFCPNGAIQKVQIHNNVSVTWRSNMGGRVLRSFFKYVLNASFEKEISERYIFTVSPSKDTPVIVATPGWPVGMQPYSTVSWIVSVPARMEANLMFGNLSQPKCRNRHTDIRVQRVGRLEEDYSRREDEGAESQLTVSESFYLNMSNCMPERGQFSVITKITLQESNLLAIILSVLAALLVISVIVLVAVCMMVRKKKRDVEHEVSVYNPFSASSEPAQNTFPKTREDNESHVYASIEETLVYTHLLKKGAEIGIYGEFDTHRPSEGHTDSQEQQVSKDTGSDNMEVGVYQPFRFSCQGPPLPQRRLSHGEPMVDNEIYLRADESEEEHYENTGPRLEPEGENSA